MQEMQTESSMSRPLNEKEMLDISALFNLGSPIDFTNWSVQIESVVQTSKQTVDCARDSRCDFFIPPQPTLLGRFWVYGKIKSITTAGVDLALPTTLASNDDATSLYTLGSLPKSTLSLLQSVYILEGNSQGQVIWEITNNAGYIFEEKLQSMNKLQDEFLYL